MYAAEKKEMDAACSMGPPLRALQLQTAHILPAHALIALPTALAGWTALSNRCARSAAKRVAEVFLPNPNRKRRFEILERITNIIVDKKKIKTLWC